MGYTVYSPELQLPTLAVAIFGLVVLSRHLPLWLAAPLAIAKAAVPFTYFAGLWGYEWRLLDDMTYFESAYDMMMLGYGPLDLIISEDGRQTVAAFADSRHTLYYVWNVFAQSIFGNHYFSAVYCNVLVTFVTAHVLVKTLRELSFRSGYVTGALVFHLLHWDYLSWTSLINVRESLVECLVWMVLYHGLMFIHAQRLQSILWAAFFSFVLIHIRIYIPVLLVGAFGLWLVINSPDRRKLILLPVAAAAFLFFRSYTYGYEESLQPRAALIGVIRFILTPQPWQIAPEYSFLLAPAVLQWIFAGPAILGAWSLWTSSREARLFVIVLAGFILLYAMTPEAQEPRHRVQLAALFAWTEFTFLWNMFTSRSPVAEAESEEDLSRASHRPRQWAHAA